MAENYRAEPVREGKTKKRGGDTTAATEARRKHIDIDKVRKLAALGLSITLIAEILEVSDRTMFRKIKQDKELSDAIHESRVNVRMTIRAQLFKQAREGNTRILLRLAEDLGVLSSQSISLKGDKTNPVTVSVESDERVISEVSGLITQLENAARNKPQPLIEGELVGESASEAGSAAGS